MNILLVCGKMDQTTIDVEIVGDADWPAWFDFDGVRYRRTNVWVPGRHDAGGVRRRAYLAGEPRGDEAVLDLLDDGVKGGECGGA